MDLDYKFGDVRERFKSVISQFADERRVPEDYYWHNSIYKGPKFRMGHVEHYTGNPVEVLHVVIVPYDETPIFGFDLVSIAENTTMACGDLSPTVEEIDWDHPFENNREVPEWADFFSENVVFTTPEEDGKDVAAWFAGKAGSYIEGLTETEPTEEVLRAQNEYMENQRQNTKTFKSLAADVGEEKATRYMHEVMFPKVKINE
jgi:hypothetical protein